MKPKILVVRKMSSLEFLYNGNHSDRRLHESKGEQDVNNALIEKILREEGCDYNIVTRRQLSGWMFEKCDYVFSAGGDGTAIATAAFNYKTPQLNLRNDTRSVGALCQQDMESAVRETLRGNFRIEEWIRQEVFLDGRWIGRALNEVVVGGAGLKVSKLARYDLKYKQNEKLFEESKKSSGIVIATGTGSTGWQKIFTPFPKNTKEFVFKTSFPDCDETRANYVWIKYTGHGGRFTLDCADESEYDLPRDSVLEIRLSESPLRVIIPNITPTEVK